MNRQAESLGIEIGADWREVPDSDPERRTFLSADGSVGVTVSCLNVDVRPDQTEQVAVGLARLRLEGHRRYQQENGGRAELTQPAFREHAWGHHVEYDGRSSDGRVFSFIGLVTPRQVVSIFADGPASDGPDDGYMHSTVQEFVDAAKFEMPKIR